MHDIPPALLTAAPASLCPHLPGIWSRAVAVFGDFEKAQRWLLKRGHVSLPPEQLMELLERIDHGVGA